MSDHDWDRANHDQTKSPDHSRKLPISINVYDLMPQSRLSSFMWFTGVSICHSGVVISEEEWAFGGHDVDGVSGVYVTKPRAVPDNAIFRASIAIGFTTLSNKEIRHELDRLRSEYTGPSYDLLKKNCNHFVEEVCLALCGVSPPAWINRIAGIGAKLRKELFWNCCDVLIRHQPSAYLRSGSILHKLNSRRVRIQLCFYHLVSAILCSVVRMIFHTQVLRIRQIMTMTTVGTMHTCPELLEASVYMLAVSRCMNGSFCKI